MILSLLLSPKAMQVWLIFIYIVYMYKYIHILYNYRITLFLTLKFVMHEFACIGQVCYQYITSWVFSRVQPSYLYFKVYDMAKNRTIEIVLIWDDNYLLHSHWNNDWNLSYYENRWSKFLSQYCENALIKFKVDVRDRKLVVVGYK